MISVRELIKEAVTRIGLVPRRQALPGDILETSYRLLQGIVSKYNYDLLLPWTQNSVIIPKATRIHIYDESDTVGGRNNVYFDTFDERDAYGLTEADYDNGLWCGVKQNPNVLYSVIPVSTETGTGYAWNPVVVTEPKTQRMQVMQDYMSAVHFQVRDVARINSVYVVTAPNEEYREYYQLEYVNHTDYDRYSRSSRVFTYTQKSEGEWVIDTKPNFMNGDYRLKLTYNESMVFDLDSDLYIPDNYVELLIVALAHKLALKFPRLDESQMNRLEKEVQVLVDNVRAPKAEDRVLTRYDYFETDGMTTQGELLAGRGLVF